MASCYLTGDPFHFSNYDRMGSSYDPNRSWRPAATAAGDSASRDFSQQWFSEEATYEPDAEPQRQPRDYSAATSGINSLGWAFPAPMLDMSMPFSPSAALAPSLSLNQPISFDFSSSLPTSTPSTSVFDSVSALPAPFPVHRHDRIVYPRLQADRITRPNTTHGHHQPPLHEVGPRASTHPLPQLPFRSSPEPEWLTSLGPSQAMIDSANMLAEIGVIQPPMHNMHNMPSRIEYLDPVEAQDNMPPHLDQHLLVHNTHRSEHIRPKKRHSLDLEKRHKVKQVRKMGACLRCRMYKEPCDQGTPCRNCLRKGAGAKLFRQPCYRESLDNVVAYRLGDTTFGEVRYKEPELHWLGSDHGSVKVKLGFALDSTAPTMTLECREFLPGPQDHPNLEHRINGKMQVINLPAIAIHDIHGTTSTINPWLKALYPYILHTLTAPERIDPRTPTDPILNHTLLEAQRYTEAHPDPNSSIPHALAVRLLPSHQFSVLNASDLSIPTLPAPGGLGNTSSTPLPPRLNAQVDWLRNRALDGHKTQALKRLKALVFGRAAAAREGWYEVFLCTFLLLSTIEHASRCQRRFLNAKRGATNWSAIKYVSDAMLAEWKYSAENLVAHFRCAMRGHVPFMRTAENGADSSRIGSDGASPGLGLEGVKLDDEARVYIERVAQLVDEKREAWEALRRRDDDEKWEQDYVWLSQLFLGDPE